MLQTPVLLITFNRPDHTRRVFDEIKKQKPKTLFVFQDGAREVNIQDVEKCAAVRAIFEESLDWNCELKTYYSDINLGCGLGPATGITWFFEQVEEGIILEDDCVPVPYFFTFCQKMLSFYKDNPRISFIGGTNFVKSLGKVNSSYYFSNGHHATWGWASWRRTWMQFDYYLDDLTLKEFRKVIKNYFSNYLIREYWYEIFDNVKKNRFNESCWDYQFYFSNWKNNQFAVIPNFNLVMNVGSDEDATHTIGNSILLNREIDTDIHEILHPKIIKLDKKTDNLFQKKFIQPYNFGRMGIKRFPYHINKRIKRLIGVKGSWKQQLL